MDIDSYIQIAQPRTLFSSKYSKKITERKDAIDKKGKILSKLVKKGDVNAVKDLLLVGKSGLRYDNDFCLLFSSRNGFYHMVKTLVSDGYLVYYNNGSSLFDAFSSPLEWSIKNGHLKIVKYFLQVIHEIGQFPPARYLIENILLKNYNVDTDFSSLLKDNESNIKKSKMIVKKNEEFNIFNKKNKQANISIYDELLIDASNDFDNEIGVDYNKEELDFNEINEIGDEIDEENDNVEYEEIDDAEINDEENEDLFGEDDFSDVSEEEIKIHAKKKTKYKSPMFKNKKSGKYMDGVKAKKNQRMEVILWLIAEGFDIKTNYTFVSNYAVRYQLTDVINILKMKRKFNFDETYYLT